MDKTIHFKLNGQNVEVTTNPLNRLLDVLREHFKMTSVKEGCSEGECGACSVIFDGHMVTSCLIPIASVENKEVLTLEGINTLPLGKIITEAYADGGAVQCGFCIPGMVIATYYLLMYNHNPSEEDCRVAISGNICRCTGYDLIVKSMMLAAERARREIW